MERTAREPLFWRGVPRLMAVLALAGAMSRPLWAAQATGTPLQQPAVPAQNDAQARKLQDLINRAQTSYDTGVANYNANHLEAARQDFDGAADVRDI